MLDGTKEVSGTQEVQQAAGQTANGPRNQETPNPVPMARTPVDPDKGVKVQKGTPRPVQPMNGETAPAISKDEFSKIIEAFTKTDNGSFIAGQLLDKGYNLMDLAAENKKGYGDVEQRIKTFTKTQNGAAIALKMIEKGINPLTGEKLGIEPQKALETKPKTTAPDPAQVARVVKDLYDSMAGMGTDNDKLNRNVYQLRPDNILEVMDMYEKVNENGLVTDILGDTSGKQETNLLNHIIDQLEARGKIGADKNIASNIENIANQARDYLNAGIIVRSSTIIDDKITDLYYTVQGSDKANK